MIDDDLGPVGGIGSDNHVYGGRHRNTANHHPFTPRIEAQIKRALDDITGTAHLKDMQFTPQQIEGQLWRWLHEEYDTHLTKDELRRAVQRYQGNQSS